MKKQNELEERLCKLEETQISESKGVQRNLIGSYIEQENELNELAKEIDIVRDRLKISPKQKGSLDRSRSITPDYGDHKSFDKFGSNLISHTEARSPSK